MAKLSTDDLSIAYKIKPEQAEKEKQRWDAILAGEGRITQLSSFLTD